MLEEFLDVVVAVPGQSDAAVVAVVDEQCTRLCLWVVGRRDAADITPVTEDNEGKRRHEGMLDGMKSPVEGPGHRLHEAFESGWERQIQRPCRQGRLGQVE